MVRLQFSFAGIYTADGKMQVHVHIHVLCISVSLHVVQSMLLFAGSIGGLRWACIRFMQVIAEVPAVLQLQACRRPLGVALAWAAASHLTGLLTLAPLVGPESPLLPPHVKRVAELILGSAGLGSLEREDLQKASVGVLLTGQAQAGGGTADRVRGQGCEDAAAELGAPLPLLADNFA